MHGKQATRPNWARFLPLKSLINGGVVLFCLLPEGGEGRSSKIARMSLISTFQVELSLRGAESL